MQPLKLSLIHIFIIGDPDRLRAVAEDFIKHYETRVAEGATVEMCIRDR